MCLKDFRLNQNTVIRRINHQQIEKEPCSFCQVRMGFDYIVEERNLSNVRNSGSHIGNKLECVIA